MTKYILHGGNMRGAPDGSKSYFAEIVKGLGDHPRVLLCFFAESKELWEGKYKEWSERITKALGPVKPVLSMATEEGYLEQAKNSDALFIYGGNNDVLMRRFQKIDGGVESLSKFKTVAGSSAGAILLADYSWGCDRRGVTKGLGIVPANTLVHYGSTYGSDDPRGPIDWAKAEAELQEAIGPEGKITKLHEGEFVVINK